MSNMTSRQICRRHRVPDAPTAACTRAGSVTGCLARGLHFEHDGRGPGVLAQRQLQERPELAAESLAAALTSDREVTQERPSRRTEQPQRGDADRRLLGMVGDSACWESVLVRM